MSRRRMGWVAAAAVACLIAGPAMAQSDDAALPGVSFNVRSGAVYATTDADDGSRLRVRFKGEGTADADRAAVSLALEELTQVDGDRTLTVTPDGDLKRISRRARVYAGTGTATVTGDDGDVTFEKVHIVVSVRGYGHRLRMIGKYRGIERPVTDSDVAVRADVLRGVVRGRPVPVATDDE